MMTANLGMLLSLGATLFAESRGSKMWALRGIAALAGIALFFAFNYLLNLADTQRFLLLSLAFHMLISFAAFTAGGQAQAFWQFNKTLFLRFLASILYSGILYLGLIAAIAASSFLFNWHTGDKTYETLFAWIAGVFNTVFFLAGLPPKVLGLEENNTYPKGLKVFTQYVLIPLATVYVVILLAYEVKLLVQWHLPKGLVSMLILGYAVFGILSILLIYPLRNLDDNKWIKTYSRSFYFLLVPLIVLLFLAIASRILPYGVTPMRYFLIVLALWLVFITAYFLLSRKQGIKIIPISLCVLALLSVYGPQSAFSVSSYSQLHILSDIFKKYGAVKDGKLISLKTTKITEKDGRDILARLDYLIDNRSFEALQPYVQKNLKTYTDSLKKTPPPHNDYWNDRELKEAQKKWITACLGVEYRDNPYTRSFYYNFDVKNKELLDIKGFDYLLSFYSGLADSDRVLHLKTVTVRAVQKATQEVYTLYLNGDKLSFNVQALADSLMKNRIKLNRFKDQEKSDYDATFSLPDEYLTISRQTSHYKVDFRVTELQIEYTKNYTAEITTVQGRYLIGVLK
jgi:hypothetical protein